MLNKLIMTSILVLSSSAFCAVENDGHFLTKKQYKKQLGFMENQSKKNAKKGRRISNTDRVDYASVFSNDAKNLHSEIIGGKNWSSDDSSGKEISGLKTSKDLANLIEKYDNDSVMNKLSPQAKWVAAQLAALKPLRGIVTRVRPLVSKSDAKVVHTFIVTWIRSVSAGINSFNPNSEWQVGFDYLVQPYLGMGKDIKTEGDLYLYMKDEVLPQLKKFEQRVRSITYTGDDLKTLDESFAPFYFDNKVLYKTMNVVDEDDRFVVIDRAEVHSLISSINLAISGVKYGLAYDWDGLLEAANNVAKSYGFNSFFNSSVGNMTAEKRVKAIKKNKDLFKLVPDKKHIPGGGVTWTKASYSWFKEGVRQGRLAWTYTKNYDGYRAERRPLIDPRAFVPFQRIMDTSFDAVSDLIEGEGVHSTTIQGESISVNFEKFFTNPPADLKAFLPVGFNNGSKELTEPNTKRKYRNYNYKNPNEWNLEVYKQYFPEIDEKGVPNAVRIMNQAWGGSLLGAVFTPVLL